MKPSDFDNLNSPICMAKVLRMRCCILAGDLAKNGRGPQSSRAQLAADDALEVERRLLSISSDLSDYPPTP